MTNDQPQNPDRGLSVIIPCYQHQGTLAQAIESADQPCVDEIIVVDDGSEPPIDLKGVRTNAPMRFIRHGTNRGLSAARNTAFALAQSEWVLPLDADDEMQPFFFPGLLKGMKPAVGAVFGAYVPFDGRGICETVKMAAPTLDALSVRNDWPATALVRQAAWRSVKNANGMGYDTALTCNEEWCFWIELLLCGWKAVAVPQMIFRYRQYPGGGNLRTSPTAQTDIARMAERLKARYGFRLACATG